MSRPVHIEDGPRVLFDCVNQALPLDLKYNHPAHVYYALRKMPDFSNWPVPFTFDHFSKFIEYLVRRKLDEVCGWCGEAPGTKDIPCHRCEQLGAGLEEIYYD